MDPRRFLVPAIGLLAVLAVAALVVTRDDDHSERVTVGADGTTTTTSEASTTTTSSTTAAPTTTTTTVPPTTVTTAARPTTTAPARTWSISPTSGPPNTRVTTSGTGCVGENAGVGLTWYDPNGQAFNGDGAAALPDGTWSIDTSPGFVPPGRYTLKAACQGSRPFEYAQARTFTVT